VNRKSYSKVKTNLLLYPMTFVEIIFAVVIGASILQFRDLLFPPSLYSSNFWALFVAYFTAIASWFGWHKSTTEYPYTDSAVGRLRSILDAIVVVTYVALLFFGSKVDQFLGLYLWSFVIVFGLYAVVGVLRQIEYHDRQASKVLLIIYHAIAVLVIAITHVILLVLEPEFLTKITWLFVFLPIVPVASFRWFREWRSLIKRNSCGIRIAVDMDGVLVEQVVPVLDKLKQEMGVNLCKCDITSWEYPIDGTNIKIEIEKAERKEDFVRQMPAIEGSTEALRVLSAHNEIVVATSREPCIDPWSREWLDKHDIPYKQFVNTRAKGKTLLDVDLLIDDYIGNIEEFIRNGSTNRQAILFAQPWNQDTRRIRNLLNSGSVRIAHSWHSVLAILGY
jgi:5'(3')-deoxyribonucleotidase